MLFYLFIYLIYLSSNSRALVTKKTNRTERPSLKLYIKANQIDPIVPNWSTKSPFNSNPHFKTIRE